jgi:hypothetical protein
MAVKPHSKPAKGLLIHFSQDSILTTSSIAALGASHGSQVRDVPEAMLANRVASASTACVEEIAPLRSPSPAPVLDWPRSLQAEAAHQNTRALQAEAAQSHVSFEAGSRGSLTRPNPAGKAVPGGSKVSMSVLGKVLDDLKENENGLVHKADVLAALRAKSSTSRCNTSFDIPVQEESRSDLVKRWRPSSAPMETVQRNQFKPRPSSAAAVRQRHGSATADKNFDHLNVIMAHAQRAAGEAKDAARALKLELSLMKADSGVENHALHLVPTPMKKSHGDGHRIKEVGSSFAGGQRRSRSRDHIVTKPPVQRQRSVPTPSLLNFSRQYPGYRSTTCW